MRILVYGIGGEYNERLAGIAHDPGTGINLLRLLRVTGARGCSLHGSGLGQYDISGELSIDSACSMFVDALDAHALAVLDSIVLQDDE